MLYVCVGFLKKELTALEAGAMYGYCSLVLKASLLLGARSFQLPGSNFTVNVPVPSSGI